MRWDVEQHRYSRQQNIIAPSWKNNIIPIIGARKESHVKDNLACLEFQLTSEQMKILNEVSKIELGYPHDFLNSWLARNNIITV